MDMGELLDEFLVECNENLEQIDNDLVELERNPEDGEIIKRVFRSIHTVKGASGMFGLSRLEKIAHAAEDVLNKMRDAELAINGETINPVLQAVDIIKMILEYLGEHKVEPEGNDETLITTLRAMLEGGEATQTEADVDTNSPQLEAEAAAAPAETPLEVPSATSSKQAPEGSQGGGSSAKPSGDTTLRVHVDVLDRLMNLVGELVLNRNQLVQLIRGVDESEFHNPIHQLDRVTSSLQESVMKTRMQPIGVAWAKLPRIVRDLAHNSGKQLELVMSGQETEVDRQILQAIQDPLIHCVRNSADHGVEDIQTRQASGKPSLGMIHLRAFHEGGQIVVEIEDDGKGIDPNIIGAKAVERGLVTQEALEAMKTQDILRFIFEAGFSTAEKVTEVSGRGVGMDVVKSNIEKIGGNIDIFSELGQGTKMRITIPLTLAIISALIVRVGESKEDIYALPQSSVIELVRITEENSRSIESIEGTHFLRLRNSLLPLIDLKEVLKLDNEKDLKEFSVIVCQIGDDRFGLVANEIFDTQEVVVKAPGHYLKELQVFAGATILGDGKVILILDVGKIAERSLGDAVANAVKASSEEELQSSLRGSERNQLLLIRSSEGAPLAIPLALISRLEEFEKSRFERADNRIFVQYRGGLLPVFGVEEGWSPGEKDIVPAVIFSDGEKSMGLAVDSIRDIVEAELSVESGGKRTGVLGAAIIEDQVHEVIDVYHYLLKAYPDWFKRKSQHSGAARKRILLVEDSAFFREMIKPLLESNNYSVVAASDGQEALDILNKQKDFDLILTDIEMPNLDGWQLAEAIKARADLNTIPVMALTTLNDQKSRDRAIACGVSEYLIKFDQDQLLSAVERGVQ